jgi:hypothetical protein
MAMMMAMRADKMKDETKVFYWADTGPVEAHLAGSYITRAQMVEAMQDGDKSDIDFVPVWESSN